MSRIKEYYWDFISDVNFNSVEDLDYQYQQYLEALKDEESSLYFNTENNESIRENQDANLGSSAK
jgi:hypothetical protein